MANLGYCGLGIMGYPMARNLARAGNKVAVWSYTKEKCDKLASEEANVTSCASAAEVAKDAECIFLCVGDDGMAEDVILNGLAETAKPGTVIVDTSTVSPASSVKVGEILAKKGIHFLGAPCTGSKPGAEGGTLTFMIGGDREVFERVRPYFEAMGKRLYYCGGPGMGLHAKLTQNLILSNILQAFNEGMVLAAKAGMDAELMLDILDNSAARSGLINFKAPYVLRRDFSTNFSIKWMHKDIGLMLQSAEQMNVPLPLTALTQQLFRAAIAAGYGEEDICATVKVLEGFAGVEVKKA